MKTINIEIDDTDINTLKLEGEKNCGIIMTPAPVKINLIYVIYKRQLKNVAVSGAVENRDT